MNRIRQWIRRLLMSLLEEDIRALIAVTPPPLPIAQEFQVAQAPKPRDREKAVLLKWQDSPAHDGHIIAFFGRSDGAGGVLPSSQWARRSCFKLPNSLEPESIESFIHAQPEAWI